MDRVKQYISLCPENSRNIETLARQLNMTRVDVIEVIIAVYFEYIRNMKRKDRGQQQCED